MAKETNHKSVSPPVEEQHHKPCATCPFTNKVEPGFLGGSSPETYVAQHFLPFRVPCHEFVDYEEDQGDPEHGWKDGALQAQECVAFAMGRDSGETDVMLPDQMYKEKYRPEVGAFKDIWDFYAFHTEIDKAEALLHIRPDTIMGMCWHELSKPGFRFTAKLGDQEESDAASKERLLRQMSPLIISRWTTTMRAELAKGVES